jgi:hypothetical protein
VEDQTDDFAARYGIGQTVKLRGTVGMFKEFEFSDPKKEFLWWVVDAGPNPVPIMKAEDIAREFTVDAAKAEEKFGNRGCYVVGQVIEIVEKAGDYVDVNVKGQDDLNLRLTTNVQLIEDLKLKPGSKIQFQGRFYALHEENGPPQIHFVACIPVTTALPAAGVTYETAK